MQHWFETFREQSLHEWETLSTQVTLSISRINHDLNYAVLGISNKSQARGILRVMQGGDSYLRLDNLIWKGLQFMIFFLDGDDHGSRVRAIT